MSSSKNIRIKQREELRNINLVQSYLPASAELYNHILRPNSTNDPFNIHGRFQRKMVRSNKPNGLWFHKFASPRWNRPILALLYQKQSSTISQIKQFWMTFFNSIPRSAEKFSLEVEVWGWWLYGNSALMIFYSGFQRQGEEFRVRSQDWERRKEDAHYLRAGGRRSFLLRDGERGSRAERWSLCDVWLWGDNVATFIPMVLFQPHCKYLLSLILHNLTNRSSYHCVWTVTTSYKHRGQN